MKDPLSLIWMNRVVGFVEDPKVDNLEIYGTWRASDDPMTQGFLSAVWTSDEVEVEDSELRRRWVVHMEPDGDDISLRLRV